MAKSKKPSRKTIVGNHYKGAKQSLQSRALESICVQKKKKVRNGMEKEQVKEVIQEVKTVI
jgi:hypothetical protein